jgi:hypothetical protein
MSTKRNPAHDDDDIRSEYDFTGGVRGKYFERYQQGTNVVLFDPDVAAVFRDRAAVNDALRALVAVADAKLAAVARKAGDAPSKPMQPTSRKRRVRSGKRLSRAARG